MAFLADQSSHVTWPFTTFRAEILDCGLYPHIRTALHFSESSVIGVVLRHI